MSKVNKNYIAWGIGSKDNNDQIIPATHTAINYTPEQVNSEGTDKVSAHIKGLDNAIGNIISSGDIVETSFNM